MLEAAPPNGPARPWFSLAALPYGLAGSFSSLLNRSFTRPLARLAATQAPLAQTLTHLACSQEGSDASAAWRSTTRVASLPFSLPLQRPASLANAPLFCIDGYECRTIEAKT
ncbi:hypothetical protein KTAU_12110 [Thermogemmatispora aurantia]|uniref:Uncharacterized protein n=1 Tax=Thermogemmatispora aurantia TaxID=2045279 RepID=A0A5J4K091_9CHLR|nr:hypothetical protein KTAU_12110 [Thermogemmatispora aurantia]